MCGFFLEPHAGVMSDWTGFQRQEPGQLLVPELVVAAEVGRTDRLQ